MLDSVYNNELKLEENSVTKVAENTVPVTKSDIKLMLNILQVVTQRGGFVLDEFQIVGELNKRLKALAA